MEQLHTLEREQPQVLQQELFILDQYYESSNELEIPDLRLEMQAQYCDRPFVCFGEQKRTLKMGGQGVLHFYTDDYRYGESLFRNPEKILAHNPRSIVEPNYSLFQDTPIAFGLQAVYKKRFIARALQDRGIRVFVDLNTASKFYAINTLGVPKGWSAFCTRGYSDRVNYLRFELEIAKKIADGNPLCFVVYGGGKVIQEFCRENQLIYIYPVLKIKNKIKALESIKETVAFFGEEIKLPTKVLPSKEDLLESQVIDYKKKELEQSTSP